MHRIVETAEGLALEVDDHEVALIRERGGNLDLVWAIRGPQGLEQARVLVTGLIDLLIHWDATEHAPRTHKKKGRSRFSEDVET